MAPSPPEYVFSARHFRREFVNFPVPRDIYISTMVRADQLKGTQAPMPGSKPTCPAVGWRGVDPTNQQPVNQRYVKVAIGRDYAGRFTAPGLLSRHRQPKTQRRSARHPAGQR